MATPSLNMRSDDPVKPENLQENNTSTSIEPLMNAVLPPVAFVEPFKSETDKQNHTISGKTPNQSNRIGIPKCNFGVNHDNMNSVLKIFKKKMTQADHEIMETIERCKTAELECSSLKTKLMEEQQQLRESQLKIDILERKVKRKAQEISLLQRFHATQQANGQVFQVKLRPVRRGPKRLKTPSKREEPSASKNGV